MESRNLEGPEFAYITTEKELLATVWALQKLRTCLHGAEIINRTDHLALTFLNLPGKQNVMADVLSRLHDEESYR